MIGNGSHAANFTPWEPSSVVSSTPYTTEAICLKVSSFRESDRIVVFYSPTLGRVSAIAKGVKKPKSKLAGACEPIMISEVHLMPGKSLETLFQYQPLKGFSGIRQDILKLATASVLVEMVYRVATEHDGNSALIYDTLVQALSQLETANAEQISACGSEGQRKLLEAEGYGFTTYQCVSCDEEMQWQRAAYRFSIELGGSICAACDMETHHWSAVVPVSTTTLQALSERPEDHPPHTEQNPLKIQRFLQYYFHQKLEKPLKSGAFLLDLLTPSTTVGNISV